MNKRQRLHFKKEEKNIDIIDLAYHLDPDYYRS